MQPSFFNLTQLGLLAVSGPDAKTLLQGQVTCHLEEVNPSQSRLGGYCNIKGRLQCIFRLLQVPQIEPLYYLLLPRDMVPLTKQTLGKYAIFSKVSLEDASSQTECLGVYGSSELLSQALDLDVTKLAVNDCLQGSKSDNYIVCRVPDVASRYLIVAKSEVMDQLRQQLTAFFTEQEHTQWELLEIQAGLPTVYPSTIDVFLPHHVNLAILGGINFKKGCYLGQEIIARMQYKGKIKKHLYRAFVATSEFPVPGEPLLVKGQSEPKGVVVRVAPSAKGCELLVMLEDDYAHFDGISLPSNQLLESLPLPYPI